jgi:hypothetical protein
MILTRVKVPTPVPTAFAISKPRQPSTDVGFGDIALRGSGFFRSMVIRSKLLNLVAPATPSSR